MSAFSIVVYSLCAVYMVLNFKYDIQMLQQNSYRIPRYWKWLRSNIGSSWRLVDVALLFLLWSVLLDVRLSMLIIAAACLTKIWIILTRKYKKPLAFTRRVWRIYSVTALLSLGGFIAVAVCCGSRPDIWP